MIPLDRSRPLWDIHILNVKTSDAEAVAFIRSHHSLGDGMSLISLILACTHKTSDPDMFATAIPSMKRRATVSQNLRNKGWILRSIFTITSTMRLIWNTVVDTLLLLATILFLKDTKTPLKGSASVRSNPKRFYHRIMSLDDIKLIKNAMNMVRYDLSAYLILRVSRFLLMDLCFLLHVLLDDQRCSTRSYTSRSFSVFEPTIW